ncbi:MAG: hypothetical protein WKG00_15725 [Polyangiaceae bacterium]
MLIPLPTEDDALLGRILPDVPEGGRSLEETARANPCADKLTEPKETPLASSFEYAQELAMGAQARATLGTFGFSGDVERATHFVYKLATQKRIAQSDTTDYEVCCKEKGCGYGYISALVYGDGEYATGEETSASAAVDLAVGSAGGTARLKLLNKRKVKGWLAAVVTVTDRTKSSQLTPLGVAQAAGITETTIPQTVKALYEKDKLTVHGGGSKYTWRDGRGVSITENEFVRRFRSVSGSDELDDVEQRRNSTSLYVSGGLLGVSVGAAVFGYLNLTRHCRLDEYDPDEVFDSSDCTVVKEIRMPGETFARSSAVGFRRDGTVGNPLGVGLAVAGTAGTIGFGIWFLAAAFGADGSATDHAITDRDAVLYTERYNRSLLRKTIKEVQKSHTSEVRDAPGIEVRPSVGFGSLALQGRF